MEKQLFVHGSAQGAGVPGAPLWARVLGYGEVRRTSGHEVATNATGCMLVVAVLESTPGLQSGAEADEGLPPILAVRPRHATVLLLDSTGQEVWRAPILLPEPGVEWRVPSIALCDDGHAWLLGRVAVGASPYELRASDEHGLLCLSADTHGRGRVSRAIAFPFGSLSGAARPRIAAHPGGGVVLTVGAPQEGLLWVCRVGPEGQGMWTQKIAVADATVIEPHRTASDVISLPTGPTHLSDLGIGTDRRGHVTVWGQFSGKATTEDWSIGHEPEGPLSARGVPVSEGSTSRLNIWGFGSPSASCAPNPRSDLGPVQPRLARLSAWDAASPTRFVLRLSAGGEILWARQRSALDVAHCNVAVLGAGHVVVAETTSSQRDDSSEEGSAWTTSPSRRARSLATSRDLVISLLAADGSEMGKSRYPGGHHTIIPRVTVAPTAESDFVCGGYFDGEIWVTKAKPIRSGAAEWMFLGGSRTWWRSFRGAALQGGIRVHGDATGAKIATGWFCGAIEIGTPLLSHGRAAFFAARFPT